MTNGRSYIPHCDSDSCIGTLRIDLELKGGSLYVKVDGWRKNAKQRKRQVTLEKELNSVMLGGQNF